MGYGTEETIFINEAKKKYFISNKYRNKNFKGCEAIRNLNIDPLNRETSNLKK
ncbi:hypothetical protein [Clostridium tagluense]|uniref:hypothetical protein n=1 Tax=Clostridium tagluense TaxID=360422 RepID=UPI001CF48E17|nr:hypothetical protein [Clostridium tagluense]MCB2300120.1 hypothetical protein [Clostridium tagluense]